MRVWVSGVVAKTAIIMVHLKELRVKLRKAEYGILVADQLPNPNLNKEKR